MWTSRPALRLEDADRNARRRTGGDEGASVMPRNRVECLKSALYSRYMVLRGSHYSRRPSGAKAHEVPAVLRRCVEQEKENRRDVLAVLRSLGDDASQDKVTTATTAGLLRHRFLEWAVSLSRIVAVIRHRAAKAHAPCAHISAQALVPSTILCRRSTASERFPPKFTHSKSVGEAR